jgi:hypothetical protein
MAEMTLGRFGDLRLEKGGPFYCLGSLRAVGAAFVFVVWGGRGQAKFA